jgi:hypothetical protein
MRTLGAAAAAALLSASAAEAQRRERIELPPPTQQPAPPLRQDTTRDTVRAGRQLPRTPSRTFPTADSVIQRLLGLEGYVATRFKADSMRLLAAEKEIRLAGEVLVEREGASLEADTARYVEGQCALFAVGGPRLYDAAGTLFGQEMTYDVCNRTGVVGRARTDFQEGSATWFLYGNLAFDNSAERTYASRANLTSCELEDSHYHFAAREVKYVTKRLMVSRPAVLYVHDVPIMWLPFIFQDMQRGRRSGILTPQFGVNDIVRNSPSYQRHVANLGYYWALGDYADAQTSLDWYAQRFVALHGRLRYRWLDRFLAGGLAVNQLLENDGGRSSQIAWSHQQQFNMNTQLTAGLQYVTSSRIVSRNAVDPVLAVGTIDSRLNFQRRFAWGQLNVGGNRNQSLDKPLVSTNFPTINFTPMPISIGRNAAWSPAFSMTNSLRSNAYGPTREVGAGIRDTLLLDSRNTSISVQTPLRVGRWNWNNSFAITDNWATARDTVEIRNPDSTRTIRTVGETSETGLDWQTGIGLPSLFQGRWNLQPAVQIVNTTSGPFMIRNRYSGDRFVSQGKRPQFGVSISPTFFGLFGGIGPVQRIRHSLAPSLSWNYAPAAGIPEEYARATNRGRLPTNLRSPARQTISIGLSQVFEAKLRPDGPAAADSAEAARRAATTPPREGRKLRLLSIQSDPLVFDLEQAREPGRTAWTTDVWGNTVASDLLRGFSVRLSHDLWEGPVGYATSRFAPTLTSVAMGFSLSAGTMRSIGSLLGLAAGQRGPSVEQSDSLPARNPTDAGRNLSNAFQRGPLATRYTAQDRLAPGRGGASFAASINYSLQNPRIDPAAGSGAAATRQPNQMLSGSVTFSPTRHWSASWQTAYNVTTGVFSDHVVRLDRDLHDWRATFTFVKSANGNFMFNFGIHLIDQPDLHFDYDQRNVFR